MQQNDPEMWRIGQKIAEQGLLFSVLVGFIVGLYIRKISWGWEIEKLEKKNERLENEARAMLEIIKTNTQTTSAAVEGFNRALEELRHEKHWDGRDRRRQ